MKENTHMPIIVVLALLLMQIAVHAQSAPATNYACSDKISKFVISRPDIVELQCNTAWPDPQVVRAYFSVWQFPDDWKSDPTKGPTEYAQATAERVGNFGLKLVLNQNLQSGKRYLLILRSTTSAIDMFIDFTTDAKGVIAPSAAGAELGRKFVFTSSSAANVTTNATGKVYPVTPAIPLDTTFPVPTSIDEKRESSAKAVQHKVDVQIAPQNSIGEIGKARIDLQRGRKLRQSKAIVGVGNFRNIFGQTLRADDTLDLLPTPVGKDDANQFYQISHRMGPGSKPSLAINIKANSLPGLVRDFYVDNFLVQPDILVDVATNDFAKKSDDTIRLGVTASRAKLFDWHRLQGFVFIPGVAYETNLHFKKNNVLFTFDSRPILKGFFQSREARRFQAAAAAAEKGNVTSIDAIDSGTLPWGWGVEFFIGLETGGSVTAQTVENKSKTATLNVPQYGIFRFRPRMHAFLEYRRFTLDWSGVLRILGNPEYVGKELPDKSLTLLKFDGVQKYMELTGSFGVDRTKHLNLSVTWKRGAQPPTFNSANVVQSGFTVKY